MRSCCACRFASDTDRITAVSARRTIVVFTKVSKDIQTGARDIGFRKPKKSSETTISCVDVVTVHIGVGIVAGPKGVGPDAFFEPAHRAIQAELSGMFHRLSET